MKLKSSSESLFLLSLLLSFFLCSLFHSVVLFLSLFPLSQFCSALLFTPLPPKHLCSNDCSPSSVIKTICILLIAAQEIKNVHLGYYMFCINHTGLLQRNKLTDSPTEQLPEVCSQTCSTTLLSGSLPQVKKKKKLSWDAERRRIKGKEGWWMDGWKDGWKKEGGCFPGGDDSWLLEPYISFVPQLCSEMKILALPIFYSKSTPAVPYCPTTPLSIVQFTVWFVHLNGLYKL